MRKEDILLILLAVFILVAMLVTIFFGGEGSRHGYGVNPTGLTTSLRC
jgi:hypothetical protein